MSFGRLAPVVFILLWSIRHRHPSPSEGTFYRSVAHSEGGLIQHQEFKGGDINNIFSQDCFLKIIKGLKGPQLRLPIYRQARPRAGPDQIESFGIPKSGWF